MHRGYRFPPGYIIKSTLKVLTGGGISFIAIELFSGSERFYRRVVMPVVFACTDAESAHRFAVMAAKWRLFPKWGSMYKEYPQLATTVWGQRFINPIGLAAGFDKHAEVFENLAEIGFGFIEVGTVTPLPQPGNDKPRVFRLIEDEAVINRCSPVSSFQH